jgi:hypothetical protein
MYAFPVLAVIFAIASVAADCTRDLPPDAGKKAVSLSADLGLYRPSSALRRPGHPAAMALRRTEVDGLLFDTGHRNRAGPIAMVVGVVLSVSWGF